MAYRLVELKEGEKVDPGTHIAVKGLFKNLHSVLRFLYPVISGRDYYYHHGVHLFNCRVIHFFGVDKLDAEPRKCSVNAFRSRGEVDGKIYKAVYNDEVVVLPLAHTLALAKKVWKQPEVWPEYDIISNNCETFATCLKTGKGFSDQASNAVLYGVTTISCILIGTICYIKYFK
jgi:hypothetical protein